MGCTGRSLQAVQVRPKIPLIIKGIVQVSILYVLHIHVVVVVVVFTLKAVPVSTQYFLASVLVQLTRTPSVVTG